MGEVAKVREDLGRDGSQAPVSARSQAQAQGMTRGIVTEEGAERREQKRTPGKY